MATTTEQRSTWSGLKNFLWRGAIRKGWMLTFVLMKELMIVWNSWTDALKRSLKMINTVRQCINWPALSRLRSLLLWLWLWRLGISPDSSRQRTLRHSLAWLQGSSAAVTIRTRQVLRSREIRFCANFLWNVHNPSHGHRLARAQPWRNARKETQLKSLPMRIEQMNAFARGICTLCCTTGSAITRQQRQ